MECRQLPAQTHVFLLSVQMVLEDEAKTPPKPPQTHTEGRDDADRVQNCPLCDITKEMKKKNSNFWILYNEIVMQFTVRLNWKPGPLLQRMAGSVATQQKVFAGGRGAANQHVATRSVLCLISKGRARGEHCRAVTSKINSSPPGMIMR